MPGRLFSSVLTLIFLCSFSTAIACDQVIRSVYVVPDDIEGLFAKKVIEKAGCGFKIMEFGRPVTLERRMDMLANGKADVIIGMNQRPEREVYALFSVPFAEERVRLWARKGETEQYKGKSLEELVAQNVQIFAPDAGWYGPVFQKMKDNKIPQITLYKDFKHGLSLLHRGRNNLVLGSENFAQYIPEEYKDISVMLPQVIHTDYLRLMYSKKTVSPETVQLINTVIQSELSDGKLLY